MCVYDVLSLRVNVCRFFPLKCLTKSDARAQRPPAKIAGFLFFETTRKNSAFYDIRIYIACIYYSKSPHLFLVANVNVVIIFIVVVVIECTEKRYTHRENESSETFRRVDRLAADFNRLGDFYDRDNAHSDRFFSDRDTREHGRYVEYTCEKRVCFFE